MNKLFESSASFILPLRNRTTVLTTLVAATAVGGLPCTGSLPTWLVGCSDFGLQSSYAASPKQDADRQAARDAAAASKWQLALDKWNAILKVNPNDEEALKGREQAMTALDKPSTVGSVQEDIELRRDRARKLFTMDIEQANDFVKVGNYNAASQTLAVAKARLDHDKGYLTPAEYTAMSSQLADITSSVADQKTKTNLELENQKRIEAQKEQARVKAKEAQERARQVDEALRRVRQLQLEMKYEEALQVVDTVLFVDRNNPSALALRDVIQQVLLYRQQSEYERRQEFGIAEQLVQNQEAIIPPKKNLTGPGQRSLSGILMYPEDWPQLSRMRGGAAGWTETEATRQAMQDLNKSISVNFNNNQLDQVIAYMKSVTNVEFYPDWKALAELSVAPENTVSLQLNDVPAATALKRVLEQIGEDPDHPRYSVEEGVVVISSESALKKKKITVVYDIRDLIFEVPYFDNAPDFNLNQAIQQGQNGGGGQGGGGGGGGFGGGGGGGGFGGGGGGGNGGGGGGGVFGQPGDDPPRKTRQELIQQIQDIIETTLNEGQLDDDKPIQELNGNLIITQTASSHREIEGLLTQLRTIRALQINVESRLINVSLEWFEQIGIDLDLYFNTNNDMYNKARAADPNFQLSDFFYKNQPATSPFKNGDLKNPVIFDAFPVGGVQTNGFANQIATGAQFGQPDPNNPGTIQYVTGPVGTPVARQQGWTPIGVSQNSLTLTEALAVAGVGPVGALAIAQPALNVGISYLDDVQVDLLIKATQADQRNVVLTAPRLTLFNGQRSWISVAKAISFISGLTPITGSSAGAFQPEVSVIYEGFVLDIEGVISADRRYVTMTVQFGLNENVKFRDVTFTGAAGASDIVGRGSSTFEASFQLPELEGTEIRTTVSVPDKGTILLGGQRKINEFEVESGVPVLSKIPFISRFFTNRVTNKTELTMLLLIRPEVIIQQEAEDQLYPGLRDTIGTGGAMGN